MADADSRFRWALRLLFLALVVSPLVAAWLGAGSDALSTVGSAVPIRAVGLGILAVVVVLFARRARRFRRRRAGEGGRKRNDDRQVEGSGEVYAPYAYNSQQQAKRESERIRDRAEEIAEAEREARER